MRIYEISFDSDTYQTLMFLRPDLELSSSSWQDWFIGEPMQEIWQPVEVVFSVDPDKIFGDFPSLGGIPPVFSARAVHILNHLMVHDVEFLPLSCPSEELYAINVIKVLNCLDNTLSRFKYFSSGRIMRIEKYKFIEDYIDDHNIFKIPEQVRNRIYVSELFKKTVDDNNLQGMVFHLVYE